MTGWPYEEEASLAEKAILSDFLEPEKRGMSREITNRYSVHLNNGDSVMVARDGSYQVKTIKGDVYYWRPSQQRFVDIWGKTVDPAVVESSPPGWVEGGEELFWKSYIPRGEELNQLFIAGEEPYPGFGKSLKPEIADTKIAEPLQGSEGRIPEYEPYYFEEPGLSPRAAGFGGGFFEPELEEELYEGGGW
jgi:hypothetical protein